MSLHKLSAGSGYEYLTRQVAAVDSTEMGSLPLADYYAAKGESPGRWLGSGLAGIVGLEPGDQVTAEEMKFLFGTGCDPITGAPLGRRYAVYGAEGVDGFNAEVARRISAEPTANAAAVRSEVGREFFLAHHDREPRDARELAGAVARYSRPHQTAVAGFDLTFSPVKSVSTLWAVAPLEVSKRIEAAHDAAVADALTFVEREVLFTREGAGGARQVETRGLIAAAFTHRDSRIGDPDLHTHVAVANKVQTRDGKWLSVYGTLLHENAVSVSEVYNTALEAHLTEQLGVRFTERPIGPDRRPVREIVGVDQGLCRGWSERRHEILGRQRTLAKDFQQAHGRPPTRREEYALAQQANLETREAKHEPQSLAEQRASWRDEAAEVLGSDDAVQAMVRAALAPPQAPREQVTAAWVRATAEDVVGEVETHRATWQVWHLRAEALRQVRDAAIPSNRIGEVVEWVVDDAVERLSINLTPDTDPTSEPPALLRADGTSVYRHSGRDHYTSRRILEAEQRIVTAAGTDSETLPTWSAQDLELAILEAVLDSPDPGIGLNAGQEQLVQDLASSGKQVQLALAPAGSGKTTAVRVLAQVWQTSGGDVVGLAPSAAAAAALGEATGMPCETLAKLTYDLTQQQQQQQQPSALVDRIRAGTLVVIDEAGMADTLTLARVIGHATQVGATVRLIGDDQQLAAIGAGGILRDIAHIHGAVRLDELVRFADPSEAEASILVRDGDASALGFYYDRDRIHVGDTDTSLDSVLDAWTTEQTQGRDCLMLAPTRDLVAALNQRARTIRLHNETDHTGAPGARVADIEVALRDGNHASVGDVIITRTNNRRLHTTGTDWVKNGDRWTITQITPDGTLQVRHTNTGLHARLPASYVSAHVDLGYASTVHTAQGLTADVMHGIVTGDESRQLLYTMLTRGRHENHAHLVLSASCEGEQLALPGLVEQLTATEALETALARDGAAVSATTTRSAAADPAARLHDAAIRYADAVALATRRLPHDDPDDYSAAAEPRAGAGPLPWLPAIPDDIEAYPTWDRYLNARAELVSELAQEVRNKTSDQAPRWANRSAGALTADLVEDIAVWRAATGVSATDRNLLGTREPTDDRADAYQHALIRRLNAGRDSVVAGWEDRIIERVGRREPSTTRVAVLLAKIQSRGIDADYVLSQAASGRRLPIDHATAALEFRIRELATQAPRTRTRPTHPARLANQSRSSDPYRRPGPPGGDPGLGR